LGAIDDALVEIDPSLAFGRFERGWAGFSNRGEWQTFAAKWMDGKFLQFQMAAGVI
jgi:hypothetical protein